ncbi:MAG: HAD family phosphatase [Aeromonadaceae bacterium]|nr:HAD family phosphatase [Aeromonadaceae bacterium]
MVQMAVCLDFDGTLVDSEPLHYAAWAEELSVFGAALDEEEYLRRFAGMGTLSTAAVLAREFKLAILPAELAARKGDRLMTLLATALPRKEPGADELLAGLAELGATLALVTGAYRHEVVPVLKAFGWQHYFKVMITRDDVTQAKPHPEPYQRAVRALGREPHQCYAVEDSETGMLSALRAGLMTLVVNRPGVTLPSRPEPYHSVRRLSSLMTWFLARQQAD